MSVSDEIIDWIIVLCLYEVYRVIRYKNIENRKNFLKSELINFLIEIGALILIDYVRQIFGSAILIVVFAIYMIVCRMFVKKLDEDKKVDFYCRVMILIWVFIILILIS